MAHQQYFRSRPDLKLLYTAKGDLFSNHLQDYVFVVFDRKNTRVSILAFNQLTARYSELFRELRVQNDLETANCNYGVFGTLDYQIADNIIYGKEYLLKKPESFFDYEICRFADISKDSTFVLANGCLSKKLSKKSIQGHTCLCISTSTVYNNWECLSYNKAGGRLSIFYGQAFAD